MTSFEAFTMMFFALDKQYSKNPKDELGDFLSAANPFLFEGVGSADPSLYDHFDRHFQNIKVENEYLFVKDYVQSLKIPAVVEAFQCITEESWNTAAEKYLSTSHLK